MANNQYEDTFKGNFNQHPILGSLTAGIAPAIATVGGKFLNTMTYQPTPEQKAINDKAFTDGVAARFNGSIGSSPGSTRIGVPTPAGTAPIVSLNFGGSNIPKTDLPVISDRNALPTKPSITSTVRVTPKPKVQSTTKRVSDKPKVAKSTNDIATPRGLQTPGFTIPGVDPKITHLPVGAGSGYEDYSTQGVETYLPPSGGGIATDGENTYFLRGNTPLEQEKIATQPTAIQAPVGTTFENDPSYADQRRWQQQQDIAALVPKDEELAKTAWGARYGAGVDAKRVALIENQQKLSIDQQNANNSQEYNKGKLAIDSALLPGQIQEQGSKLANESLIRELSISKHPLEMSKIKAEIEELVGRAKLKAMTVQGSDTDYFDPGKYNGTIELIKLMDSQLSLLDKDSPEAKDLIANRNLQMSQLAVYRNKPSKPALVKESYMPVQTANTGDIY